MVIRYGAFAVDLIAPVPDNHAGIGHFPVYTQGVGHFDQQKIWRRRGGYDPQREFHEACRPRVPARVEQLHVAMHFIEVVHSFQGNLGGELVDVVGALTRIM